MRSSAGRRRAVGPCALSVAAVGALAAARFLLPPGTPPIRTTQGAGRTKSRAILERVAIGGTQQWVLERSVDVDHPILLFVHGGPGTSQLTMNRRNTKDLEAHFTVVNWDQRGAGKSYRAMRDRSSMTIDQFVQDTRQLVEHLLATFGHRQLVLVGHSWGTVVGTLTVAKYPELFSCYVGIGQVANMREGESVSYEWTLQQARASGDDRAVAALEAIGPPPFGGDWQRKTMTQRRYLGRFGGEVHASRRGAFPLVLGSLLFSREYSLIDRVDFFRGIFGSMRLLWPELLDVDLAERVPALDVPVFFVEGRHDWEAPSVLAERYFELLRAPRKELVWFENSAHLPNFEERQKFDRFLLTRVLPIAATAAGRTG